MRKCGRLRLTLLKRYSFDFLIRHYPLIFLKVLLSIGETFTGAQGIQTWLNLCARLISRSIPEERLQIDPDQEGRTLINLPKYRVKKEQMTSVIWTTPLGLPIVQPYRKSARKQVMTAIQSVFISDPNVPSEGDSIYCRITQIRC
jgi:DNA-directed RNA polymerase